VQTVPGPVVARAPTTCHDAAVATAAAEMALTRGHEALASGDWESARAAFQEALDSTDSAEALDGLGRALWWLRDERGAIVHRERAYAGFRRDGELARAARVALWLAREYGLAFDNDAAARGWLARAERLLRDVAPGAERGWVELARAEGARDAAKAAELATTALEVALAARDPDLELRALAQLGLAEVTLGDVDGGLARLDEAMAAATSGEPADLETFADICCTLMLACERAGDSERPQQWSTVLDDFVRSYDHVTLLAFCRTCCADVYAANGRIDAAEAELEQAVRELAAAGQRSRCIPPSVRLAEIRVLQGRLDEAEQLLEGLESEPEAVQARVSVRLARGEAAAASALLVHRIDELGWTNLLAAPLLAQLVEARLAGGRLDDARAPAAALDVIAERGGRDRVVALAVAAHGRLALAEGREEASRLLQEAVNRFAALGLRLEAARTRLELARSRAAETPDVAVDTARHARAELEALGALRDADAAAAFMRSLGAKGRAGPKAVGGLSRREIEVLRLLGEGLTNKQIGERLFISPKTVEHHLGRSYSKLEVTSRAQAAAYAARHLDGGAE
jgi:DNA-binding CsgD family transcriptional regulator